MQSPASEALCGPLQAGLGLVRQALVLAEAAKCMAQAAREGSERPGAQPRASQPGGDMGTMVSPQRTSGERREDMCHYCNMETCWASASMYRLFSEAGVQASVPSAYCK